MKYKKIVEGRFLERPNRFIAMVEIDGSICKCHVKNTGRCKELLIKSAKVYLEESDNPNRKTRYSLIGVEKETFDGNRVLINMDSQAPNKVVFEYLKSEELFKDITFIKPEYQYGNSRIDFYLEYSDSNDKKMENTRKKVLIEVKGVTLEENGIVRFPDAPTQRGIKHINELKKAISEGFEAYIIFVIQMDNALYFEPNYATHKEFGEALKDAEDVGVKIIAFTCKVQPDILYYKDRVKVKL